MIYANYVHYRFSDYYAKDIATVKTMDTLMNYNVNFQEKKMNLMMEWRSRKIQAMNDSDINNLNDFNSLIEEYGDSSNLGQNMQKAWDNANRLESNSNTVSPQVAFRNALNEAMEDLQFKGDIKSLKAVEGKIEEKAQKVVDLCYTNFSESMTNISNSLANLLNDPGTLADYAQSLINSYLQKKGGNIKDNMIATSIMKDVLTSGGIKALKVTPGTYEDLGLAYNQAILLLTSFGAIESKTEIGTLDYNKTYTITHSRGNKTSRVSGAELFQKIAQKLGGFLTNVKGDFGEVAWLQAILNGHVKTYQSMDQMCGAKFFNNSKTGIFSGITSDGCHVLIQGKVVGDSQIDTVEGKRVSKGDVMLNINKDGASLAVGYSIKDYTTKITNGNDSISHISLVSGTSFLNAYNKTVENSENSMNYLYNVISGWRGKGYTEKGKKFNFDDSEIDTRWQNIVTSTAISNFLDALVGVRQEKYNYSAGALTFFLVVNGKIYPVDEILSKLTINNIKGTVFSSDIKSISIRSKFCRMNTWLSPEEAKRSRKKDDSLAETRSELSVTRIETLLKTVKLQVTLNNLLEMFK
jgi:hypothetical protein